MDAVVRRADRAGARGAAAGVGLLMLDDTQLTKLTIEPYRDQEFTESAGPPWRALLNPTELAFSRKNTYQATPSAGSSAPQQSYGGGEPDQVQIDLLLDGSGVIEAGVSVGRQARRAARLHRVPGRHPPAVLRARLLGPVRLPRRAHPGRRHVQALRPGRRAAAGDGQAHPQGGRRAARRLAAEERRESPDLYQTWLVAEGERLDAIAYRVYGDPAFWRPLAAANGLRNPRGIVAGPDPAAPAAEWTRSLDERLRHDGDARPPRVRGARRGAAVPPLVPARRRGDRRRARRSAGTGGSPCCCRTGTPTPAPCGTATTARSRPGRSVEVLMGYHADSDLGVRRRDRRGDHALPGRWPAGAARRGAVAVHPARAPAAVAPARGGQRRRRRPRDRRRLLADRRRRDRRHPCLRWSATGAATGTCSPAAPPSSAGSPTCATRRWSSGRPPSRRTRSSSSTAATSTELHLTQDLTRAVDSVVGAGWDVDALEAVESEVGRDPGGPRPRRPRRPRRGGRPTPGGRCGRSAAAASPSGAPTQRRRRSPSAGSARAALATTTATARWSGTRRCAATGG